MRTHYTAAFITCQFYLSFSIKGINKTNTRRKLRVLRTYQDRLQDSLTVDFKLAANTTSSSIDANSSCEAAATSSA